jgi:hypothetical protein
MSPVGLRLAVIELAFGADAIFLTSLTGFQIAQAAQFTFHRHTHFVGHVHHTAGHIDVVAKVGRGLAIFQQRAVHHHRRKPQIDRTLANRRALAVVLVHDQRNMGPLLGSSLDQMLDEGLTSVLACARAGLQDDRGTDFVGGGHDGLDLLQIVDVESWNAVAVDGGMVQQLAH